MKNIYFIYLYTVVITALFLITGYTLWKYQYTKFNLLRLDPLEERKSDLTALSNSIGKDSVIWLVGDSRIAQWNTSYLKPLKGTIINLGIEGQTSKQVLENFKKYLEISHPQCVVIQVGINDLKVIGLVESKTDKIVSGCYANTIEILQTGNKNNINMIYTPIFPNGNIEIARRLLWNSDIDQNIIEFNKRMKEYCLKDSILYFDAFEIPGKIPPEEKKIYHKDFLHLNDAGYKYLSEAFIRFYNSEFDGRKQK